MLTRVCPNCGRNTAPMDRFCGSCRYPLAACKPKRTFKEGIRAGLIPAVGSAVFAFWAVSLWVWASVRFLAPYGRLMLESLENAAMLLLPYILIITVLGAGAGLLLSGCCANSRVGLLLSAAGTTVVLSLFGVFLSIFAPRFVVVTKVSAEMIFYMVPCVRGILLMIPMIQGALFLCGADRKDRKAVLWQAVILILFLALVMALEWGFITFLGFGTNGISFACVIGGVLTMLLSALTRCFK